MPSVNTEPPVLHEKKIVFPLRPRAAHINTRDFFPEFRGHHRFPQAGELWVITLFLNAVVKASITWTPPSGKHHDCGRSPPAGRSPAGLAAGPAGAGRQGPAGPFRPAAGSRGAAASARRPRGPSRPAWRAARSINICKWVACRRPIGKRGQASAVAHWRAAHGEMACSALLIESRAVRRSLRRRSEWRSAGWACRALAIGCAIGRWRRLARRATVVLAGEGAAGSVRSAAGRRRALPACGGAVPAPGRWARAGGAGEGRRAAFLSGVLRAGRACHTGPPRPGDGSRFRAPSGSSEIGRITAAQGRASLPSVPLGSGGRPASRPALPAVLRGGQGRSEPLYRCLLDFGGRGPRLGPRKAVRHTGRPQRAAPLRVPAMGISAAARRDAALPVPIPSLSCGFGEAVTVGLREGGFPF